MKVLVSIPVHEEPEVIAWQIRNIEHFFEDPVVILHVSAGFDIDPASLSTSPRVILNPERYATGWGSGICARAHLSNLEHARKHLDFDYALLASSNEAYVRPGLETYLSRFEAGATSGTFALWHWRYACMQDRPLRRFLRRHRLDAPAFGQLEGSFFRRDVLDRVLDYLAPLDRATPWTDPVFATKGSAANTRTLLHRLALRPRHPLGLHHLLERFLPRVATYPREEIYLPTALSLCNLQHLAPCVTYMNWSKDLELSEAEVDAVARGDLESLPVKRSYPPGTRLFSVKRILRTLDAPLRRHIESLHERT